jgi:DNA-directed RNA polymerase II subunit RPB2
MTIGTLVDMILGKVVCTASPLHDYSIGDLNAHLEGLSLDRVSKRSRYGDEFERMFRSNNGAAADGTPFRAIDIHVIRNELKKLGCDMNGDEVMYDGTTGEMLKALIFYVPTFYQRLKHMVIDKVHGRARGTYAALSHQPVEGRALKGGLRIGVQERDCMLGQGASRMVQDRMLEQSDPYYMWVCNVCGLPAIVDESRGIKECRPCGLNSLTRIKLPYGTKMILQELMGMNIVPRLMTTPHIL